MKPLFPGKSEIDQLNILFKELGTPNDKIWPGYGELPLVKKVVFAEHPYNNLHNRIGKKLGKSGFDLINRFLTYCPERRITAAEALNHEFFKESPKPVDPSMFPTWPARSEGGSTASGERRKAKSSPKPPSGGKQYAKQQRVDADEEATLAKLIIDAPEKATATSAEGAGGSDGGFHMMTSTAAKKGFNLRF